MNGIVEIDKAGRIVVPKKLRDSLHLTPGTRLRIEREGDKLVLEAGFGGAQLRIENGTPLILPADNEKALRLTNEMVNELIAQGRREREDRFLSFHSNGNTE